MNQPATVTVGMIHDCTLEDSNQDDFDLEIARTRQNEKLIAYLEECARQPATVPLEEIERELGLG